MMRMEESSIEQDGIVWFFRTWTCCGDKWSVSFKHNDLEAAAWTPICKRCGDIYGWVYI